MKRQKIALNIIPMEPGTLIINGENKVLTACNFLQLTGKTKTCKTNILMSIIGGCFSDEIDTLGLEINKCPDDKHVIYINTEMSAYDSWSHLKALTDRIGRNPNNLSFFNLADTRGKQLREDILDTLNEFPPYLLIIDGIVDACEDFNNLTDAKITSDWLSGICDTYACGCIVTLHQNPEGYKDSKSRGHLGTFMEQRAVSTLTSSRNKEDFTLTCSRVRSGSGFQSNFIWTKSGLETVISNNDLYVKALKLIDSKKEEARSEIVKYLASELKMEKSSISRILKKMVECKWIEDDKKTLKTLI